MNPNRITKWKCSECGYEHNDIASANNCCDSSLKVSLESVKLNLLKMDSEFLFMITGEFVVRKSDGYLQKYDFSLDKNDFNFEQIIPKDTSIDEDEVYDMCGDVWDYIEDKNLLIGIPIFLEDDDGDSKQLGVIIEEGDIPIGIKRRVEL